MSEYTEPPFPIEDTPPISEEPMSGDLDHSAAEDDHTYVTQDEAEPGPDHPSDPALVPQEKQPPLSHYVALSPEEMAEKGKLLAKKLIAIEGLEEERKDINHQIKDLDEEVKKLRNALISGTVEVMTEQTDLLRSPVGPESAAAQFEQMAQDAEKASEGTVEGEKTVEELNQMAADIQAGKPGTEPSQSFLNDIENHKARSAAKRKGKK